MLATATDIARELRHALDPVPFAVERLAFDPDPWQAELLRSSARWVLLNCSRQAGKSTAASVLAVHTAVFRPKALVLLVSPSLRQSGELFRKMRDFLARLTPRVPLNEDNALSCSLSNGSRIVCLPGAEATVRGFSAPDLVIEDEAARVDDALYRAIRPMLATTDRGRLMLMSSPFGKRGHFHDEWAAGGDDWMRIEVAAADVPRISEAFLAAERRALGSDWFRQEYQCAFLEVSGSLFNAGDIAAMLTDCDPLGTGLDGLGDVAVLDIPNYATKAGRS